MHVIKPTRFDEGVLLRCECGSILAYLPWRLADFHSALEEVIQGHRQHVRIELDIPGAWRQGTTTQAHDPIDPLRKA